MKKWISSGSAMKGLIAYHYVETPTIDNTPVGSVSVNEDVGSIKWWAGKNSGTAVTLGQAKSAVEKLWNKK